MTSLSQEQIAEYKETFALFDKNGDGTISSAEIGIVLKRTTGRKPTPSEIARLTKNVDKDRNGKIDFKEFVGLLENNSRERKAELQKTFHEFDTNKNGFITKDELKAAFTKAGEKITDAEVADIIARVDKDKDNKISFDEFVAMMDS